MLEPEEYNSSVSIVPIKVEVEDEIQVNRIVNEVEDPVIAVDLKFEEDMLDYESSDEDPDIEDDNDPDWSFEQEATTSGTGPYHKRNEKKSAEKRGTDRSHKWKWKRNPKRVSQVSTKRSNIHVEHDPDLEHNIEEIGADRIQTELPNPGCSSQNVIVGYPTAKVMRRNAQKSLLCSSYDYAPLGEKISKKCTLAIAKFLATDMQPYNLVEDESFKDMVKVLNPRYVMPGRNFFSNSAIPKLYIESTEKLKEILPKDNAQMAITCDCWTSLAGQPYLAITIHFIDCNWNLISACLSCTHFDDNHTAYNIKNAIKCKLEEWNLQTQSVVSCTTDNDTNIKNAIDLMNVICIPCFAHSINIGVNRCLEVPEVKKAVSRLKSLQNSIAHSWKMKRDLKEAQQLLQVEVKNLPSACPTRWWSTLKLCQRFLENQFPICKMLQNFPAQKQLMPEGSEVFSLENFVETISVLEDITDNLTGENFITSSAVLPLIRQIKKIMIKNDEDNNLKKILKEKVLGGLERFNDDAVKKMLQKSTFVDPRFRTHFFDNDVKQEVKEDMIDELKSLSNINENNDSTKLKSPPTKKKKGLAAVLEDDDFSNTDPSNKNEKEIENYLSMPKIGLNENPLIWWKHYAVSFPGLSIIAKKYLCIQGSSVPSERVFSKGGNIINKKRCTLSPKNAEMQIFLSYNQKILEL